MYPFPDVTSYPYLTAEHTELQFFASGPITKMSTPNEDLPECNMELSLVSILYNGYYGRYYECFFQMQSPVGGDDDVFIGNVSLDEGLLDAEDDVKVDCPVPEKVSVSKY